jgi:hypothetical protein
MTRRGNATIIRLSVIGGLIAAAPTAYATPTATGQAATGRARQGSAQARPGGQGQGKIDPYAEAVLKHMCDYLGGLRSIRVDTTTIDEKVATTGQKIQEVKESRVELLRPNRLAVDRTGPAGHVLFRYDGKQFAVYGIHQKLYASAPAPASLDAAIDEARDRYGVDAPGGDLLTTDAHKAFLDGLTEGRYVGLEPIGGVMTHHLAMRKGAVDYQLWVKDGAEPVPVRYVITSRDLPGEPQFTLELRNFEPNPPLSEASFTLVPPPTAQRVTLGNTRTGAKKGSQR